MKLHEENQEAKTKKEIEKEIVRKEEQEARVKFIDEWQAAKQEAKEKDAEAKAKFIEEEKAKFIKEAKKVGRYGPPHELTPYELNSAKRKRGAWGEIKKKRNSEKVKKLISKWSAKSNKKKKRQKRIIEFLSWRPKNTVINDLEINEDQQIREIQLIKKKIEDKHWFDSISEKNSEDFDSSVEEWQSSIINKNETPVDEPTQDFSTCPRCNGTGGINESCKSCGGKGFI